MDNQQKKSHLPNIVKSNTAFKLAEQWVGNMTESKDEEQIEVVGRPDRLGLGAKVPRQTKIGLLEDPLDRKLYAKISGRNRNSFSNESALAVCKKHELDNDDDDDSDDFDGDSESRTHVFDKKRSANVTMIPIQTKKRK